MNSKPLRLDVHGAFIRRTDLRFADLTRANFTGADASWADFRGANLDGAILDGAILKGANLSQAKNLTPQQLRRAIIDDETVLPDYIDRDELALT